MLTLEEVEKRIKGVDVSRFMDLQQQYEGKPEILSRENNDSTKPNNKLVNNFQGYIVDIILGYFIGKAINYTSDNKELMLKVQEIFDDNTEPVQNLKIAKQMGIKGRCYEIVYIDENAKLQFAKVNAENLIPVYSNHIKTKLIGVIRIWQQLGENFFSYYDEAYIKTGKMKKQSDGSIKAEIFEEQENIFGEVPVIEYINNEETLGDFEKVISLINAYDKSRSDTANDFEYFTDAYLLMKGCGIDIAENPDSVKAMKQNRLIEMPEGGDAEFLIKQINDVATENNNTRLKEDIHKFSFTPDLTDKDFAGSISGIALQFKLFGLEQIAQTKELFMSIGLRKRLKLITKYLNITGGNYNEKDIVFNFVRNKPVNIKELVETMIMLKGTLSESTILSNIPFVSDVAYEMKKREEEEYEVDLTGKEEETEENNV